MDQQHYDLIKHLGESNIDEEAATAAQLFICKMYKVPDAATADCTVMIVKSHSPETLPRLLMHSHFTLSSYSVEASTPAILRSTFP